MKKSNSADYDDVEFGSSSSNSIAQTYSDDEMDSSGHLVRNTDIDKGLTMFEVFERRKEYGTNEVPTPATPTYMVFVHQFTGFLPIICEIAAIILIVFNKWRDFLVLFTMLLINACLGFHEERKSKMCLDEISASYENEITVRRDGEMRVVPVKELVPGDVCLLIGGTVLPADVLYIKGDPSMLLDTSVLTGEAEPRKYPSTEYGDVLHSGTTVLSGECYGIVIRTGTRTELGKTLENVTKEKQRTSNRKSMSVFEEQIMYFVKMFVVYSIVFTGAIVLAYHDFDNKDAIEATMLTAIGIITASIPIALPLVLQVSLALGASYLAKKHGAIVKHVPALQDIASMSVLCSDKTGTLTTAKMTVVRDKIIPLPGSDYTKHDVLRFAKLSSNVDKKKDSPIDTAIVNAYYEEESMIIRNNNNKVNNNDDKNDDDGEYIQRSITGFNSNAKRVVAFIEHKRDGSSFTVAKGLPSKIIDTGSGGNSDDDHECQWKVVECDSYKFKKFIETSEQNLSKAGYKTIAVAYCEGDARKEGHGPWNFVGIIPMIDPPREDTASTISSLQNAHIGIKMITGDHTKVAKETSKLIGLINENESNYDDMYEGRIIHTGEDVRKNLSNTRIINDMIVKSKIFAEVLPSDKREIVVNLRDENKIIVGMTGDGVNDVSALVAANVGIAVDGSTDAVRNVSDLILTKPGLNPIYGAVLESRKIFERIKSYAIYRMASSLMLVLTLTTIAFSKYGCVIDSLWILVLALVNDVSLLPVAYDNANATTEPQNARCTLKLACTSLYFGVSQTIFSLCFIMNMTTTKEDDDNEFSPTMACTKDIQGFIWLQLVLVTELSIFSVRSPTFFWKMFCCRSPSSSSSASASSRPSLGLTVSILTTCVVCSIIAVVSSDVSLMNVLYIWLFNIASFIFIDIGKVLFRKINNDEPGDVIITFDDYDDLDVLVDNTIV